MNATRRMMEDPRAAGLHRNYSKGLISYETYRTGMVARADELTAEPRGQARKRLVKTAIAALKGGGEQEEVIRSIMNDAGASRLEPIEDDRYYWARGIVNFAETALGWRDKF